MDNAKLQLFKSLPNEVQDKIYDTLGAYDTCNVIFENGEYKVFTASFIISNYPEDFRVVGYFHKDELFTEEEQITNYVNTFRSYPPNYRGPKDWGLLREVQEAGWGEGRIFLVMVDGEIVKADK